MLRVSAVVFDVGETLVDESRAWTELAGRVGVTPLTLMAALGAVIERGDHHREVWSVLGVDPPADLPAITSADLYPDALPCLRALRAAGLLIGMAGNQPEAAEQQLRTIGFEADFVASSAGWGVEKPSPRFFERVAEAAGCAPSAILYVGDRVDNDVLPARAAGMRTAFIRRGPWGFIHAGLPQAALADLQIDSLGELVGAVGRS
jgi:HAD superfamily hydrolase (TIGR01509 family)